MKAVLATFFFLSFSCACSSSEIFRPVEFSQKHVQLAREIQKLYEPQILEAMSLDPDNPVSVETALVDLDGNGQEEVLAILGGNTYFCGSAGCNLLVFKDRRITKKNLIMDASSNSVEISDTTTRGFRKIRLNGMTVWQWSGNKYN